MHYLEMLNILGLLAGFVVLIFGATKLVDAASRCGVWSI